MQLFSMLLRLLLCTTLISAYVILPDAEVFRQSRVQETQSIKILAQDSGIHVQKAGDTPTDTPLPVVIWHGLGDSAGNQGLKDVAELINEVHPGTYVLIISQKGIDGPQDDRQESFFGNLTSQIEFVCDMLANDPILSTAPAIDAIGFSQGGQFLRGYVERCGHWAPPVRSLITFGSQHNGIAEFQKCKSATDWVCQGANALLKSSSVWSDFVQSRLIPAQYYRNIHDMDNYLAHSNFLADINNERKEKNKTYAENLSGLQKFVMIMFSEDNTVIPKESGWFAEVDFDKDQTYDLRTRDIYKEDWIGLKKLDEKNGLVFEELEGGHMRLKDKDLKRLFGQYLGPVNTTQDAKAQQQMLKPEL